MTELPARLEKLRFIIAELNWSYALSQAAPTSWDARLMARHVLVRAQDFVAHSRQLRKLVRPYGAEQAFNAKKETYAQWFDEYFGTVRDKLGAHVQDMDFGLRIDLWNGVDVSKIGFFVEGAVETYESLAGCNLPGYLPVPDISQDQMAPDFVAALEWFRGSGIKPRAEFAVDALGMTRPGTVSGSGTTPIHERASQLVLIARWIDWDLAMLDRFSSFPGLRRILTSRLITDVLSYADCLVTRPLPPSAPQTMPGLNDLMETEQEGTSPAFVAFLAGFQFHLAVGVFRSIRNLAGGHLEVDPAVTSMDICARLDAVDIDHLKGLYTSMRDMFAAACKERVYLTLYLADGQPIRGAVPNPLDSVKAYGAAQADTQPELVPVHDWHADDVRRAVFSVFSADEVAATTAFEVLLQALRLQRGEEFAVVREAEGFMSRTTDHFTLAHNVLLEELLAARTPERAEVLFELLRRAGHSWPSRTAETLIRYRDAGGPFAETPYVISLLARVMQADVPRFANPVRAAAAVGRPWPLRREAVSGLFRTYLREEGLRRINDRREFINISSEMEPFLDGFPRLEIIELLTAMTSIYWDRDLAPMAERCKPDLDRVADRLLEEVSKALMADQRGTDVPLAERLVKNFEMVGLVLHLSLPSKGKEYFELLESVREGRILVSQGDASSHNLIQCLWLVGDKDAALSVATRLARASPGNADYELLRLGLLSNISGHRDQVLKGAARVRRDFVLDAVQEERVNAIIVSPEP